MIEIRPSNQKRSRGVLLPPIPRGKSARILQSPAPSAPTSLKEVYQKHSEISQKRISNEKDT
ncbi:MAG: hypothetical protein IJN21_05230 [Clostridia bacterium]|nr:hypothetical protein [Clostridiales bacterium]MBQ3232710.1 hypothetical protein [Clostridia bacterium]MBQ6715907.1 hypothetical protein [Clostridia bacterium]